MTNVVSDITSFSSNYRSRGQSEAFSDKTGETEGPLISCQWRGCFVKLVVSAHSEAFVYL